MPKSDFSKLILNAKNNLYLFKNDFELKVIKHTYLEFERISFVTIDTF